MKHKGRGSEGLCLPVVLPVLFSLLSGRVLTESEELENLANEHGEEMSERKSPGGTDSAGPRRPVQEAEGRGRGRGSRGEALRTTQQGQGTFQSIPGVRPRQQAFWAAGSSQLPLGVTKRLLGLV